MFWTRFHLPYTRNVRVDCNKKNLEILFSNFIFELVNLSAYKVSCKMERLLNFLLRIPYLINFRLELPWKDYCYVWNQHAQIRETANANAKENFKLGTKIALFGCFVEFEKIYCHAWNQHPRICGAAKFHPNQKNFNFGTTNVFFGYL